MNKVKILLLTSIAAIVLPSTAAQYVFVAGNNSLETRACIAAAENKLLKFKRTAKLVAPRGNSFRKVVNLLKCNDKSLADFTYQYDADKTLKFIDRFSKHDVLIRREVSEVKRVENAAEKDSDRIVYVKVN